VEQGKEHGPAVPPHKFGVDFIDSRMLLFELRAQILVRPRNKTSRAAIPTRAKQEGS
jgi:hypothetical protein